jgi:hypothetical protein
VQGGHTDATKLDFAFDLVLEFTEGRVFSEYAKRVEMKLEVRNNVPFHTSNITLNSNCTSSPISATHPLHKQKRRLQTTLSVCSRLTEKLQYEIGMAANLDIRATSPFILASVTRLSLAHADWQGPVALPIKKQLCKAAVLMFPATRSGGKSPTFAGFATSPITPEKAPITRHSDRRQ